MTSRLHFIVEGETEERFVKEVLVNHLGGCNVSADVRLVKTGRRRGKDYRGGITSYAKIKNDITKWMKEDQRPDAFFTTMFDFYGLPNDFPGQSEAVGNVDPYKRIGCLEAAFKADLRDPRFLPYIQLHEFESMLLADPQKLEWEYLEHEAAIRNLVEMVGGQNPELINDGPETAPSKRIIQELPGYKNQKAQVGPVVAEKIGISVLKKKCRHFGEWMQQLESLSASTES